nr:ribosomal protein S13 [Paralia sulcata]
MAYLLETELPNKASIPFALKKIYGIGKFNSINLCKKLGFSKNLKISDLTVEQKNKLIKLINESKFLINSDLRRVKNTNKKKLVEIKLYRGIRRIKGFPVRGQRTRSNAKTAKKIF